MSWEKAPKEADACKDFAERALNRITELEAENERLRKELAGYRKGDCRRKIDKAMGGE